MHRRCSSDSICLPFATNDTMAPVQRWDGHAREATDWNDLRRVSLPSSICGFQLRCLYAPLFKIRLNIRAGLDRSSFPFHPCSPEPI